MRFSSLIPRIAAAVVLATGLSGAPAATAVTIEHPSSAAARPTAAPQVTVARLGTGGYRIRWTGVSGATGYKVYYETVSTSSGSGGLTVDGSTMTSYRNASSSGARSMVVPDSINRANVHAGPYSMKFGVRAFDSGGAGPMGTTRARCAEGYFVAARGSGENGGSYNEGLGGRGRSIYDQARSRLGLKKSTFQATAANYPAAAVTWRSIDRENYRNSEEAGKTAVQGLLASIVTLCPKSHVVAWGYSQGADAVGDAFQALSARKRDKIFLVSLLADAKRNPDDSGIQYRPSASSGHGIVGTRSDFSSLTDRGQVQSWCWSSDDVCSVDGRPLTFHGSAYDCYEDWAARDIAGRARGLGWRAGADNSLPTCTMQQ